MHIVMSSGIFISLPPFPSIFSRCFSHPPHTHLLTVTFHTQRADPRGKDSSFSSRSHSLHTHTHTHTHRGAYGEDEAKGQQRLAPPSDVEPADTL